MFRESIPIKPGCCAWSLSTSAGCASRSRQRRHRAPPRRRRGARPRLRTPRRTSPRAAAGPWPAGRRGGRSAPCAPAGWRRVGMAMALEVVLRSCSTASAQRCIRHSAASGRPAGWGGGGDAAASGGVPAAPRNDEAGRGRQPTRLDRHRLGRPHRWLGCVRGGRRRQDVERDDAKPAVEGAVLRRLREERLKVAAVAWSPRRERAPGRWRAPVPPCASCRQHREHTRTSHRSRPAAPATRETCGAG